MGLLDFVRKLKDDIARKADAIIPGDQSSWYTHTPAPAPTPQQRQIGASIGAAAGLGPQAPTGAQTALIKAAQSPTPTLPATPTAPAFKPAPPPLQTRGPVTPIDVAAEFAKGIGGSLKDIAQGTARVAPTVAASIAQPGADAINNALGQPTSPITIDPSKLPGGKTIFGDQPIGTYQSQAEKFSQTLKDLGFGDTTAGLASIPAAGGMAALDLFSGGKGKTIVKELTGATTEQAVKELLTKKFGESATKIPDDVIKALAKEKDANKVAGILKGGPIAPVNPQNVVDDLLPNTPTGSETRGFTETVQNSPKAAPEVQAGVSGSYDILHNADTFKAADAEINKMGYEQAIEHAKTNDEGHVVNQAMSLRLADSLQQEGRFNDAIDVLNKVAQRATKNGQDVQILAAYNRLTPEGIVRYAMKGIDEAKKEFPKRYGGLSLAPEKASALRERAAAIQAMPEGTEKMIATHGMLKDIAKLVPSTNTQKALTIWKAGLLTGIKGQLGNQVGNASHLILRKLADVPSASIDAAIGTVTGQRGKTFTLKGLLPGIGEGVTAAKMQIKHGFDPQSILNNKYDVKGTFFSDKPLGKAAQAYTDTIFRLTAAGDRPYYYAALRNSLQDQAKAAAITARIPRSERKTWIENFIKSPTEETLVRATSDAQEAVFANDNVIGDFLKKGKGALNKGGALPGAIGEINIPFTGVPSSVATAVINYSPVGGIKSVYDAIMSAKAGAFTADAQRELSTALGKAATGTGVMWLGYKLFLDGRLTLGYPQDPKERALWQQEGKQPYSVLIGDKWRSLNYTGPIMAMIGIGGQVAQNEQGGADPLSATVAAGATAGQAIVSSSPLRGVQSALDVVSDPAQNAPGYLNSLAGSTVPTLVKDVSNATDDTKRQIDNPLDAIKGRIPGVRTGLMPAVDEFGQPMPQEPTGAAAIFDPFKSTEAKSSPMTDELRRLQDAGEGIVPSKQDAKIKLGGQDVKLTPEQLNQYKQVVGQKITTLWQDIITSDAYQQLDDAGKNSALTKARNAATTAANAEFARDNQLGDPQKALSDVNGLAASVLAGTATAAMFTTDPTQLDQSTKVQQLKDAYAADKAAGKLSTVEDFKRRKAIATAEKTVGEATTAQIAKNYSKDAVSLASLSKKDLAELTSSGQVSQSLLDEMKAYKADLAKARPSSAPKAKKGRKVAIRKGGSTRTPKIKVAKTKAPKGIKTKVATVKKVKIAKVKVAKARLA